MDKGTMALFNSIYEELRLLRLSLDKELVYPNNEFAPMVEKLNNALLAVAEHSRESRETGATLRRIIIGLPQTISYVRKARALLGRFSDSDSVDWVQKYDAHEYAIDPLSPFKNRATDPEEAAIYEAANG